MTRSGNIVSTVPGRERGTLSLSGRGRGVDVASSPGHERKRKHTLRRGESSAVKATGALELAEEGEQVEEAPPKAPKECHTLEGLWQYVAT